MNMVLAERNSEIMRNGRRSRGPSPNGHGGSPDSSSDEDNSIKKNGSKSKSKQSEYEEKIRVGKDYQASCPELIPTNERKPELLNDRALLVWSPTKDIPDNKLEEYISVAKEKYGYNGEQALGMLFWHKHDLERAVIDLANFTPFPDEWTVEDKVLFEQAFQFHGKSFHRIRQMLPDKSIASLVKYYYSWKKTRHRQSVMDRQEKAKLKDGGGSENGSENGSNDESDNDEKDQLQAQSTTQDLQQQQKQQYTSNSSGNTADTLSSSSSSSSLNKNSKNQLNQQIQGTISSLSAAAANTAVTGTANSKRQQQQQQIIGTNNANSISSGNLLTSSSSSSSSSLNVGNIGTVSGGVLPTNQQAQFATLNNPTSSTSCTSSTAAAQSIPSNAGCCTGCGVSCNQVNNTPHGNLCNSCYHHWRRTGTKRPTTGPYFGKRFRDRNAERHKRKPPRGMHINHDDIVSLASSNNNQDELLANTEREIISLLSQVQQNKQHISSLKRKISESSEDLRPNEQNNRINSRWNNDELLLAVHGIRKFGKDFQAIAETIGTKTEAHVRTFFVNYRRRYNLDVVLKEHEAEKETQRQQIEATVTVTDDGDEDIIQQQQQQQNKCNNEVEVIDISTNSTTNLLSQQQHQQFKQQQQQENIIMEIDLDNESSLEPTPAKKPSICILNETVKTSI